MRSVTILALSLMFVGVWSQDSAIGQTSAMPPVSLAPPHASAADSRTPNSSTPRPPNPAVDYDGFSVGAVDDDDTPSRVMPPVRYRATRGSGSNTVTNGHVGQLSIDQEDEALKRKLTICRDCK